MADTIQVTYKVMEDGTLKRIAKDAEGAARSTDKASKSTDRYSKRNKGVAQAGMNSTKAFSKMTTGIEGGLVPAYATLAAHVFAVTAAFGVLSRAAAVKQLNEGLLFTGRAAGQNLPLVADNLRSITDNAVSAADAMKAVAIGTSAGFDQSQMEGLTRVAKGASLALGRDMTDALDRLTRGAAKLEPEILDELGIMVRLDDATEKFAATLGKGASDLSQFERRMAFTNAIIEQGEMKFGALSQAVDANPFNKLAATFDNLVKSFTNFFNIAVGPVAGFLADNVPALVASIGILGTGVINKMVPGLTAAGDAAADMAADMAESAKQTIAGTKAFTGAPKSYSVLIAKIKDGSASTKEYDKAVNSLEKSIGLHKKQMKGYIASHGEDSEAVSIKRRKLEEAEQAHYNLTHAQTLETQSTRMSAQADIMAAAATGNLKVTYQLLKTEILANFAATKLDMIGKSALSKVYAYLKTTIRMATLSVKAFGLALLQSIPIIGQVAMAGMLLWEGFKWLFGKDGEKAVSPLADAIEESRRRTAEYPEIINDLADAYDNATTSADKYITALKVQNGLVAQGLDNVKNLRRAEMVANKEREIAARRKMMSIKQEAKAAKDRLAALGIDAEKGLTKGQSRKMARHGGLEGVSTIEINRMLAAYRQEAERAAQAERELNDAMSAKPSDALMAETTISLQETVTALTSARSKLQEGTDEFTNYGKSIDKVNSLLAGLTKDNLEETIAELTKLKTTVAATEESFNGLAEVQAKMQAKIEGNKIATGLFSFQITQLKDALDKIDGTDKSAAQLKVFKDALKGLGLQFGVTAKDAEDAAKTLLTKLEKMNTASLESARKAAESAQKAQILSGAGAGALAAEEELAEAKRIRQEKEDAYNASLNDQTLSKTEKEKLHLEFLTSQTEEKKKQLELSKQLVKEATRRGGDQFGAATETGEFFKNNAGFFASKDVATSDKIAAMSEGLKPMMEQMNKLGPEGELTSAVISGALLMAEAFTELGEGPVTLAKGLEMAAMAVNALSSIQKAQSKAAVAEIDKEIEAEKKRDGNSAASVAKLAALEKKKEAMKRKAFEQNKKMQMAQTVIATSSAIVSVLDDAPAPYNFILAGLIAAMGAKQLSIISGTQFQGGASAPSGPSNVAVGQRNNSVDLSRGSGNTAGELAYARGAQGVGNMNDFRPAFTGYKHRAGGGYIVGEQGPEVFMPSVPGEIIPSGQSGNSTTNVNFAISTVDARGVEDLLANQRGNIIGMIREAANEHGEMFLEGVQESAY